MRNAGRFRGSKKKYCPFTTGKIPLDAIDYKNLRLLRKFVTESHKIVPSRITGVRNTVQHKLALNIKHARFLALIPYCDNH